MKQKEANNSNIVIMIIQKKILTHSSFLAFSTDSGFFCCWGGTLADILSSGGTFVSSTTCMGTDKAGLVS